MEFLGEDFEYLCKSFLTLHTEEECKNYLLDLCSMAEIVEFGRRLHVARLLHEKKNYNEIAEETSTSSATISRVNRCLRYGNDGYRHVLEEIDREQGKRE